MSESITVRCGAITDAQDSAQIAALLNQVYADLVALQNAYNSHTHSGVTAGSANSAGPSSTISTMNLQP